MNNQVMMKECPKCGNHETVSTVKCVDCGFVWNPEDGRLKQDGKAPKAGDIFERVDYKGLDRPDYILKNGKAFNIYGAFDYIQAQQAKITRLAKELDDAKKQKRAAVSAVHDSEFEDIGYNVLCALGEAC